MIAVRPRPKFSVISKRQLSAFGRNHVGENGRARLGSAGIFIVHQVGQLLPLGGVGGGVVDQARDDAVHAGGRELGGGVGGAVLRIGLAMKSARLGGQRRRQQVGQVGGVPAAIRQRELTAEQQQAAAAAIHELADQFLLAGSEIAGFHRPDDQSLIGEKILRRGKESRRPVLWDRRFPGGRSCFRWCEPWRRSAPCGRPLPPGG